MLSNIVELIPEIGIVLTVGLDNKMVTFAFADETTVQEIQAQYEEMVKQLATV